MRQSNQIRLASALVEISIQTTRKHNEDYLYELVNIASSLDQDTPYILTTRECGADGIERFGEFYVENLEDGIKTANQSLGVDCVFVFKPNNDWGFIVDIVNVSLDKSTMNSLTNGLERRGIKYNVVKNF